jgi:hypothetical protein
MGRFKKGSAAASVACIGALTAFGSGVAPAGAAGPPVERFDGIYVTCAELGDQFIVSIPGDGPITPGPVLGTNLVLVPYELHYVFTFTPVGGTAVTESSDIVKIAPRNATLDTCTANGSFSDETGTYSLHLEVKVAVRGHA